ncbi:MAG: hypothetical protein Q9228_003664 [Teloschistes exilis]
MDTDELYEACITTFRRLGVGNEEEAQDITEEYIRRKTYLSDRRGQEEQILEIWHRCRAAIQSPTTGLSSAGQSWQTSHQLLVQETDRFHSAGDSSSSKAGASTPAEAGPSSMPTPSRQRSQLNPEVPSFYPWSYLGLPAKPIAPHLLPKEVQKANYQLRLTYDNQIIGSLDRRIAAAQRQINELKAAQDRHYADIQEDFDFLQASGLDTATGLGRHKMLHAQWCNEQADKKAEELRKKTDEKAKLVGERSEKFENLYPKDGELGPDE